VDIYVQMSPSLKGLAWCIAGELGVVGHKVILCAWGIIVGRGESVHMYSRSTCKYSGTFWQPLRLNSLSQPTLLLGTRAGTEPQ
jgi:hypothetical protein